MVSRKVPWTMNGPQLGVAAGIAFARQGGDFAQVPPQFLVGKFPELGERLAGRKRVPLKRGL